MISTIVVAGASPQALNKALHLKQIFKKLWPYIRVALSIALLWLATRSIDWQALRDTKIAIHPVWFALALVMLVLTNLVAVLRWGWLMRSVKLYRPAQDYITLYFAGGLINQGLPSTIGTAIAPSKAVALIMPTSIVIRFNKVRRTPLSKHSSKNSTTQSSLNARLLACD